MILRALFDEEEAEITYRYASVVNGIYGSHIKGQQNIRQFADKQLELLNYSNSKLSLGSIELDRRNKEDNLLNDPEVQKLINDFIYMRDNGIFEKIFSKN